MNDLSGLKQILLQSFKEDAAELLIQIQKGFENFVTATSLEKRSEAAKQVFRASHALKGASRAVERQEVDLLAARLEEKFKAASMADRCGFAPADLSVINAVVQCLSRVLTGEGDQTIRPTMLQEFDQVKPVLTEIGIQPMHSQTTPQAPKATPAPPKPQSKRKALDLEGTLLEAFTEESAEIMVSLRGSWNAFKAARSGEARQEKAGEIFRNFHTLKGGGRAVDMAEVEILSQALEEKFRHVFRADGSSISTESMVLVEEAIAVLAAVLPGGPGTDSGKLDGLLASIEAIKVGVTAEAPAAAPLEVKKPPAIAFKAEFEPLFQELSNSFVSLKHAMSVNDAEQAAQQAQKACQSLRNTAATVKVHELELLSGALDDFLRKATRQRRLNLASSAHELFECALRLINRIAQLVVEHGPPVPSSELDPILHALDELEGKEFANEQAAVPQAQNPQMLLANDLFDLGQRLGQQTLELLQIQSMFSEATGKLADSLREESLVRDYLKKFEAPPAFVSAVERLLGSLSGVQAGYSGVTERLNQSIRNFGEDRQLFARTTKELNQMLPLGEVQTQRALLVWAQNECYLLASDDVIKVLSADEVIERHGKVEVGGHNLLAAYLPGVLDPRRVSSQSSGNHLGVVVRRGDKRGVLLVDSIGGLQDIKPQQIDWPINSFEGISGFAIVDRCVPAPILSADHLLANLLCEKQQDPQPASPKQPRVLLVDDSLTSRQLIKLMLENHDYTVTARIHGKQAYDTMVESNDTFDILVSDVEMPYMDGLELIVEMRKMERFKNFPIILISTLDSPAHRQRGLEVGADEYVAKGDFNSTALVQTIERLLARK